MENFEIIGVLNHNVVLVQKEPKGTQFILIGKGLGFSKKVGMKIALDQSQIEKSFLVYDTQGKMKYLNLIEQFDDKLIGVCSEITLLAEKKMGKLNENLLIVLTDHINFAIERIKRGMAIQNPFVYEIKTLYPDEYEIGLAAKTMLRKQIHVEINDDEVAFIALHLNAAKQNEEVSESLNKTRVVKMMISVLEESLGVKFERDLTYIRLINHFRASMDRVEKNIIAENPLLPAVRKNFKKAYALAQQVGEIVKQELGLELPDGELGYLAIHIDRIARTLKNKK